MALAQRISRVDVWEWKRRAQLRYVLFNTFFLRIIIGYLFKEGEIMVAVPVKAMLTIDSIPPSFVRLFPKGTSIHGTLAAFLAHGNPELLQKWNAWQAVWPPRHDFEESMPILWTQTTSQGNPLRLPPAASGLWSSPDKRPVNNQNDTRFTNLLPQQEERLHKAWKDVVSVFPKTDWDIFSYYWLILNTRSFYYVTPGKPDPDDWNDAIALVPFADYMNHSDDTVRNQVILHLPFPPSWSVGNLELT